MGKPIVHRDMEQETDRGNSFKGCQLLAFVAFGNKIKDFRKI
jgi:hypothetical protein